MGMLAFRRTHRRWKEINFRRTGTVLAAEFLHGLYQRHNPFLNPFRFANTVVVFRPWQATSYAPVEEWDRLSVRFGSRFLRDHERVCAELDRVLDRRRVRSTALADELEATRISELADDALMDTFVRAHHVPLGEIYEVNLVQVEHALHAAVRAAVGGAPDARLDSLVADWCMSAVPTVGGVTDVAFLELVLRCKEARITDPAEIRDALTALVREHSSIGAAYGADTVALEGMEHRFREFVAVSSDEVRARLVSPRSISVDTAGLDASTIRLLDLMRKTGEVRDRNKQLLGRITKHRNAFLAEIGVRRGLPDNQLRLYLVEELLRLMEDCAVVPEPALRRRMDSGMVFSRHETVAWPEQVGLAEELLDHDWPDAPGTPLRGLCASPGRHVGTARVVSSAADLERMHVGDVLVAPGTDFDLLLLLRMAGAIVTEEGGLLSHAAVVARELGVPCLIGVSEATRRIRDGQQVVVDASAGTVNPVVEQVAVGSGAAPVGQRGAPDASVLVPLSDVLPLERIGRKAAGILMLRGLGLPTPEPAAVVPSEVCAELAAEFAGGGTLPNAVAEAIAERYAPHRVALRSSSLLEDTTDATGAGVYHSEIGLPPRADVIVKAIRRILASRVDERARAYHERGSRDYDAALALLVMPFEEFTYQGTAVSHSPWGAEHVMVEYFDSDRRGGCPEQGGEQVHFPRSLARAAQSTPIPHLFDDLAEVAAMTLRVSEELSAPVEVEWGISDHRVVLLQARHLPARTDAAALSSSSATTRPPSDAARVE